MIVPKAQQRMKCAINKYTHIKTRISSPIKIRMIVPKAQQRVKCASTDLCQVIPSLCTHMGQQEHVPPAYTPGIMTREMPPASAETLLDWW